MSGFYSYAYAMDLDAVFMARVNAPRANVGLQNAGVDLADRYETIGTGTPIAATGFKSGGVDLASLFRDINLPLFVPSTLSLLADNIGSSTTIGYSAYAPFGTLTPNTIGAITVMQVLSQPAAFFVDMYGDLPQLWFTQIVTNGRTFLASAASRTFDAPNNSTRWTWSTSAAYVDIGSYSVAFT